MRLSALILLLVLVSYATLCWNVGASSANISDITFKVHVAFDDKFREAFTNDTHREKYVRVFFNAVNLMFRETKNPKIQFEVNQINQWNVTLQDALVISDDKLNATGSLSKVSEYTKCKPEYNQSDIIFLFTGREVFSWYNSKENYEGQGLTWEKGICNHSKRVVIVRDNGKHFNGLPSAGFQLARLLGAPTSCTPDHYRLRGNDRLFNLSDCAAKSISELLRELWNSNQSAATDCIKPTRKSSQSYHSIFRELPASMISNEGFCKETKDELGNRFGFQGVFSDPDERYYLHPEVLFNLIIDTLDRRIFDATTAGCWFRCCNINRTGYRIEFDLPTYFSFDGSTCPFRTNGTCLLGVCHYNISGEWVKAPWS